MNINNKDLKTLLRTGKTHSQILAVCNECDCCDNHKQGRPVDKSDLSCIESTKEKEVKCCDCSCRHSARWVTRMCSSASEDKRIRDL